MNPAREAPLGTVLLALGLASALAGCAAPGIQAQGFGPGPDLKDAGGYRLDYAQPPGASGVPSIPVLVEQRLKDRGMTPAAGSPRYLIEAAFSDRPAQVGAYARTGGDAAQSPDWLAEPTPRRWWRSPGARICTLSLRFTEAGREVYRVRATRRGPASGCGALAPGIVDAALAEIPLPAARAGRD